jgi:hypothetical protein
MPQEIIDEIGSYSGKPVLDKSNLAKFSLVCRSWVALSRRYLFAQVKLKRRNAEDLQQFVMCKPDLARYIRAIGYRARAGDPPTECSWINVTSSIHVSSACKTRNL